MRARLATLLIALVLAPAIPGCGDSGPASVPTNPAPVPTAKASKGPPAGAGGGVPRRG